MRSRVFPHWGLGWAGAGIGDRDPEWLCLADKVMSTTSLGGAGAGVVDCKAGTGSVELRRYAKDHPFAQLQGSDNIIAFTTQRYAHQPLIVR